MGVSMTPSLKPGQLVIASGIYRSLHVGDVVIIAHDHIEKVKRVHKIQGQKVFIIGDNSRGSLDSRSFGWLSMSHIIAKVIWPRLKYKPK
jgi:type IV secretory pathway protease TraF